MKDFVTQELGSEIPLLAYSGGPDSKALLYALLEVGIRPAIAHVDHGWREESLNERIVVEDEAKSLGLIVHIEVLKMSGTKNLEDEARKLGWAFFKKLPYSTILMGHHADDLAETTLKRVLEGASLTSITGMTKVSFIDGQKLLRPFLSFNKSNLIDFLENKKISYFLDKTNTDSRFLRGRLRTEIIPSLSKTFGKEVSNNLCLLSTRAFELKQYLDLKVSKVPMIHGDWGIAYCVRDLEKIEIRHLLKPYVRSRNQLESILEKYEGVLHPNVYKKNGWVAFIRSSNLLTIREAKNILRQYKVFLL